MKFKTAKNNDANGKDRKYFTVDSCGGRSHSIPGRPGQHQTFKIFLCTRKLSIFNFCVLCDGDRAVINVLRCYCLMTVADNKLVTESLT